MDVMYIIINIVLFLLGGIIASFVMCLADRYGVKTMMGRSVCDACGTELSYMSLIPFLGGLQSCKHCHKKGGGIYVIFEMVFATVFLGISNFIIFNSPIASISLYGQFALCGIATLLISLISFLGIFDSKHKVFPTRELYLTILVSVVLFFVVVLYYLKNSVMVGLPIIDAVSWIKYFATGIMWGVPFLCISLLSQEKYMGYGDGLIMIAFGVIAVSIKMINNISDFTTFQHIPEIMNYYFYQSITEQFLMTLLIASISGLIWGAIHNFITTKKIALHKQQAIPFGPPLIIGFLVVLMIF